MKFVQSDNLEIEANLSLYIDTVVKLINLFTKQSNIWLTKSRLMIS